MTEKFDIIIVGAGPGGYVAAIRAAQLGMKTAIVESTHLGGICLNWGCIPTKALLRSSEVYHLMQHATEYGLSAQQVENSLKKIVERSRGVAEQLSSGIKHLMKKNKVTVLDGHGSLAGKGMVSVEKNKKKITYQAKHIVLATGARPRELPNVKPDGKYIWTYKDAMVPEDMPASVLVIGSGAIGMEFASFYRTMGAEVSVVEIADRILLTEDEEISKLARTSFEKQGMKFYTSTAVSRLQIKNKQVHVDLEHTSSKEKVALKIDRVILAVGIQGNVENIGIEKTRVKVDRNHIVTNEWLETGEPGVYAIGDVTGPPWLAHKASHEAVICIERLAGQKAHPLVRDHIPGCIYTNPQMASVGLTEAQAKEKGFTIKVGRFPAIANGKAIALGEPEGLVKTIYDAKTGELLGAHMIGAEVTEMVHSFALMKTMEGTEEDVMRTIYPHPTLSEMIHESTLDAFGRAIHY